LFDSYVEVALEALLRFTKVGAKVRGLDLRKFNELCQAVDAAKAAVNWPKAGYKSFDQALWVMGQEFEEVLSAPMRKLIGPPPRGLRPS
jgi:hypothetical protein